METDSELVERLYDKLRAEGVDVWWDKKCLPRGQNWEQGFVDALSQSDIFVPVLSKKALAPFASLTNISGCDNVLLEYQLALDLKERDGKKRAILPVFVGETSHSQTLDCDIYGNFFKSGGMPQCPDCVVLEVETKLQEHLGRLDDPLIKSNPQPVLSDRKVSTTLACIIKHQGVFVMGMSADATDKVIEQIKSLATQPPTTNSSPIGNLQISMAIDHTFKINDTDKNGVLDKDELKIALEGLLKQHLPGEEVDSILKVLIFFIYFIIVLLCVCVCVCT